MNAALSPTAFEKALTVACMRAIGHAPIAVADCNDELACAFGATVKAIAKQSKLSVPQTRRRLQAMHLAGTLLRYDREGGSTTWWPVGLADLHKPVLVVPVNAAAVRLQHVEQRAPAPGRQAFTPSAPVQRQHWSEVLGVERDCSTGDATRAYRAELSRLNEHLEVYADPDVAAAIKTLKDAYSALCREHEIQIEE
jgi:hypothetical protein